MLWMFREQILINFSGYCVMATTLMIPILAILADAVSLYGGYLGVIYMVWLWDLFWNQVFDTSGIRRYYSAIAKTFFLVM